MNFNDFDKKMRLYEQALDQTIVPGMYIVARLDGNGFSKMTCKKFKKPFDEKFRDIMVKVVQECMNYGFRIVYGYTQSDEISLLFHLDDDAYGRKVRKINSLLAAAASARFSLELGEVVEFDCRVAALPDMQTTVDEFLWRQEDCNRNALNSWCYWTLRNNGKSRGEATSTLKSMSVSEKNELLFQNGINYNDVPSWQKRGIGFYYKPVVVNGKNPKTGEAVKTVRTKMIVNYEIPYGDAYRDFVTELVRESGLPRDVRMKQALYDALSPEEKFIEAFQKGNVIAPEAVKRKFGDKAQSILDRFLKENKLRKDVVYQCPECYFKFILESELEKEEPRIQEFYCDDCDRDFDLDDLWKEEVYVKL